MAATLTQNGTCACGKVKYEVSDSPIIMNSMCHCKTCSRMRSCSPVHLILIPAEKLVFTENEDLVEEKTYEGTKMMQAVCKSCGCGIYQCPEGAPFRALFPVCFQIEQGEKGAMLSKELLPGMHVNYENRLRDWDDDLPKFQIYPPGPKLNNDGSPVEEEE